MLDREKIDEELSILKAVQGESKNVQQILQIDTE